MPLSLRSLLRLVEELNSRHPARYCSPNLLEACASDCVNCCYCSFDVIDLEASIIVDDVRHVSNYSDTFRLLSLRDHLNVHLSFYLLHDNQFETTLVDEHLRFPVNNMTSN